MLPFSGRARTGCLSLCLFWATGGLPLCGGLCRTTRGTCGGGHAPWIPPLAQLLGGPTRDTASVLKTRGSRPAGVRAYGGCRGLATVPSRPGSPGPHRSERTCQKRGRTGASLLAWAVCLWSRLLVCACVCRTPPLLPRLSAGLPGTCPGRRAAESPIGLGRVQCRLSSDGRLGWAAPAVGSLPGFFGGQPT
jgi:hypothetical protein